MTEEETARTAAAGPDTVHQPILESVEAPRLKGIGTEEFVQYKQRREVYERRIKEKNEESGVSVRVTTYRNSISKPVLDMFVTAQWVPVETTEEITEEQLRACVEERAHVNPAEYDLGQIERDLKQVRMGHGAKHMSLEMQVLKLGLHYATTLDNLGYSAFIQKQPQLAVGQVLKRVTHEQLRNRLLLTIKLRKEDGFKKNYNVFMRELVREAKQIDRYEAVKRFSTQYSFSDSDDDMAAEKRPRAKHRLERKNKIERGKERKSGGASVARRSLTGKRDRPACLNKSCSEYHFMNECHNTPETRKKELLSAYYDAKKKLKGDRRDRFSGRRDQKRKDGSVGVVGEHNLSNNSSLFSATFCDGAVDAVVLADQGSDINVIPPNVFELIASADSSLMPEDLSTVLRYSNALLDAEPLCCSRKVSLDVMLRIRHGTKMLLRGIEWLVSDKDTKYVIIGRSVLSAIGLDNRVLMAAACDRNNGVLNIPEMLRRASLDNANVAAGSIHSLLYERGLEHGSTYQSAAGVDDDMLEESDVYVDLGDDPNQNLDHALTAKVGEAVSNGLSPSGRVRLTELLSRYKSVFGFGWESPYQPTSSL